MLAGVNYLDEVINERFQTRLRSNLKAYYLKTILHEFTHILNQTKKYPSAFAQVTPGYVLSDWANQPGNATHYIKGFITDYAMYSEEEDFAEMLSEYLLTPQEDWDAIKDLRYYTTTPDGSVTIAAISDGDGFNLICAKLEIVRTYMKEVFSIDIDALRDDIQDRIAMIVKGYADLDNLGV
jgi:substrate import-associated zinc metallohydrolase lipoprotein